MIVEPELRIPDFVKAGADIISVHAEQVRAPCPFRLSAAPSREIDPPPSPCGPDPGLTRRASLSPACSRRLQSSTIHLHRSVNMIKDLGCKAGVVLNPGTPLSAIEYVLDVVDLVLIMSVNPGFGGQSFIESQVKKTRELRALCDARGVNPWIEIDGGVTPANAYKVIEAGANALVAGSAVFGAKSYKDAIAGIKASKRPVGVAA